MKRRIGIIAFMLAIMWFLEIVDVLFLDQAMNGLGLLPRSQSGLWGIFLMPFLHAGMEHLLANTFPLLVLGGFIVWRRIADFISVTIGTTLLVGIIIWLLGSSNAVYIGASGLVFGYFGFLLFRGFFERSFHSLSVALLVVILYGGLILGVVPRNNGISWEAHLFGFLSGALCARILARRALPVADEPSIIILTPDEEH